MKIVAFLAGALLASATRDAELPIQKVVKLIAELKAKVVEDGKAEQASYDQYACWCENTLERKAADISTSKEVISETGDLIKKLKGEIASHGAEVVQLTKDIASNAAAVKDASSVRDKEFNAYNADKLESENCIGALENAVKVMTGAGTKTNFLATATHQAQLLSVAGNVRRVLRQSAMSKYSSADVELVKSFVSKPMEFLHASSGMSAAQVGGPNPFGDYAPASTQIQGILKGMYDGFALDLEKDNAAEAESEKTFEALMATKKEEKATLVATLQKQETDEAAKTKTLSESEVLLDDTTEQLAADTAFFKDTKEACQDKAAAWSVRTRLRTEELNGMTSAINILSSGDAAKTFKASAETFLQVSSVSTDRSGLAQQQAVSKLKVLAAKYSSIKMAKIAVMAQTGGHFDKVLGMIDMMIGDLREEEQNDIAHRDLCENQQNANGNEAADLDAAIKKTKEALGRMKNTQSQLGDEITALEGNIKTSKDSQAELLKFRNKETKEFRQALKDDADAIGLMKQAITSLTKFYKDNKMPLNLAQAPEYAKGGAPATWDEGYGGQKSQSTGILAILAMLVEDSEKEMTEGRADDADAQAKYEKQNAALQETLDAQEETKVNTEKEKADLEEKMDEYEKFSDGKKDDASAAGDTKKALGTECAWVKKHFESRRKSRKCEIAGLVEAKGFLAGGDSDAIPPMMEECGK